MPPTRGLLQIRHQQHVQGHQGLAQGLDGGDIVGLAIACQAHPAGLGLAQRPQRVDAIGPTALQTADGIGGEHTQVAVLPLLQAAVHLVQRALQSRIACAVLRHLRPLRQGQAVL